MLPGMPSQQVSIPSISCHYSYFTPGKWRRKHQKQKKIEPIIFLPMVRGVEWFQDKTNKFESNNVMLRVHTSKYMSQSKISNMKALSK